MSAEHTSFQVINLHQLAERLPDRVSAKRIIPPIDVHIPPISYGQVRPPERETWQYPENNWFEPAYPIHDGFLYTLKNAVVHGELGIISVDGYVLTESLHLALPEFNGLVWLDPEHLGMPNPEPYLRVPRAVHALCGYVGNRNYAHWWVDVVPVAGFAIYRNLIADHTLLFQPFLAGYQRQTIALMPEIAGRYVNIEAAGRVRCDELLFVPRFTAADYTPHPGRMGFIAELKRRVGAESRTRRRLYLSRRDATARPLSNADEIEGIAAGCGYEVVTTSGLSVADQIRMFSEAERLISPHGAGLANMLFCPAWSRVLELQYDQCINWSLRRLAAVVPMSYGCVVGRQEPRRPEQGEEEARDNPWSLDPAEFRAAVTAMA